jgi:hypothetical protein
VNEGIEMRASSMFALVLVASLTGCVHMPVGPSVMALPGSAKSFEEFRYDDIVCRDFAEHQTGISPSRAANDSAAATAAVGTAVGAATGAAIGAAAGDPAMGAAVGAGSGLLGGTLIGAENAESARYSVQHRYDIAYVQCMYAKGNQVPVPAGTVRHRSTRAYDRDVPPPPRDVPRPPRGSPPAPPPHY